MEAMGFASCPRILSEPNLNTNDILGIPSNSFSKLLFLNGHFYVIWFQFFVSYMHKATAVAQGNLLFWKMFLRSCQRSNEISWSIYCRTLVFICMSVPIFETLHPGQALSHSLQESRARGLKLVYCTVNGKMVGAPVGQLSHHGVWQSKKTFAFDW